MKRYALYAVALLFLVGGAFAATRLTINPSEMRNGETKTFTDDGRKITVHRDGDTTKVTIEDRPRAMIDGFDLKEFKGLDDVPRHGLMPRKAQTWFVCPKDHTVLRVPEDKVDDNTFKCPLDGTTMEKKKGRGFAFFFDDKLFESTDL